MSKFVIYFEEIIYLFLYNLHDSTVNTRSNIAPDTTQNNNNGIFLKNTFSVFSL